MLLALWACSGEPEPVVLPPLPPKVDTQPYGPAGEARPLRELVIAFTGEVRGEIEPCGCPTVPYGGFVRRGTLLDRMRAQGVPLFVLDAGEMLIKGEPSTEDGDRAERARAVLDLAAATGLDAWAPGPTDLLVGGLSTLSGSAALSATWRDTGGAPVFPGATVLERDGLRLGVIGLGAPARGLGGTDPVSAATEAMRSLSADTWVALSNLDPADTLRVAEQVPGLGAVLSTREDQLDPPRRTGGAPIVETADRGRYVSLLHVALASDGVAWRPVTGGALEALAEERTRVGRLEGEARATGEAKLAGLVAKLAEEAAGRDLVYVEDRPLGSDLDGDGPVRSRIDAWKRTAVAAARDRTAARPPVAGYATASACYDCHTDRFTAWTFDPHTRAYEALLPQGRELDVECVACHTTAWGRPGGNAELTSQAMRTWKAVQCESCHGPLAGHPEVSDVKPRPIDVSTCRACHDEANSPQFDYAAYRARLSCTSVSLRESEQGDTPKSGSTPPR